MYENKTIAAVIPCHNEETQITQVIETMPDFVDSLIVVDDRSSDSTVATVKALAATNARVHLIEHEHNEGGGGAIVNMSSMWGLAGYPEWSPYITAKHAVSGMTKSAALEVAAQNIRINAVAPGPTLTPATSPDMALPEPEAKAKISELNPTGQMAPIETIAATVAFLCSDLAQGINGHDVPIDGGQLAKL